MPASLLQLQLNKELLTDAGRSCSRKEVAYNGVRLKLVGTNEFRQLQNQCFVCVA